MPIDGRLYAALRRDLAQVIAHHQYWRVVTAMLVNQGLEASLFNVASLAIAAARRLSAVR